MSHCFRTKFIAFLITAFVFSLHNASLAKENQSFEETLQNLKGSANQTTKKKRSRNEKIKKGLIVYYPFDDDANDASGNDINGKLKGDATFKSGKLGKALYLDGSGDYVSLGNGLNLNNHCTVAAWIKPEDLSRKYSAILAKYETNKYGPYDFDLHYDKVNIWISTGDGDAKEVNSNKSIQANKWHHVVWVIDNNKVMFYVNGKLDKKSDIPKLTQNDDEVTIGRQALMFSPYEDLQFKGYIDELRVYKRSLTQSSVEKLYDLEKKE